MGRSCQSPPTGNHDLLREVSGGWTVRLLALLAITVPQLLLGLALSRPAYVEDELDAAGRESR